MFVIPVLTLKLLIVSYLTAKRQLIHNRTAQTNTWNQTYDFIVVGAGGSGCVVANRLTEDPNINVILLEAGGPQNAIYTDLPGLSPSLIFRRTTINIDYYNEAQNNLHLRYPNGHNRQPWGKLIGGSTSHNQLAYFRAQQKDLDNWVKTYGAKGWSFREVLPFYIRFENNTDLNILRNNPGYHGTNGPVQISTPRVVSKLISLLQRAYNELGFMDTDFSGANQTGTNIAQSFVDQNGFRSESGNAYIDPNPHPNNLDIVSRAFVIKILFNGLTAVGVEFDRNDTTYRVYARKEVILSAGPYQTPQLLMLSGIGPRNQLQSFGIPVLLDLPVGNNYMNLPVIPINFDINQNYTNSENLFNPPPELTVDNLIQIYFNKSGPLSQNPLLLLMTSTSYNLDKDWPNVLFISWTSNRQLLNEVIIGRVKSRGKATLQSRSPYIPLRLDANLLVEPIDFDNVMEGVKMFLFVMERTSIAKYVIPINFESYGYPSCVGRYMYECNESMRCYIQSETSIEHPCGTCRMGAIERNDVVVGPNLLVKYTHNLRICDTSIFPDLPLNGITAEALMIGEKCSQIIKDCYHLN